MKIIKSDDGKYYSEEIYKEGYYPQEVIQDERNPNLFRNYYNPELYFGILPNGDLTEKKMTIDNNILIRTLKPVAIF